MKLSGLLILTVAISAGAQQLPQQIEAESTGECSPNILSNQGKVEFTCNTRMDRATAKRIVFLLNQILARENNEAADENQQEINHKLDRILNALQTVSTVSFTYSYDCSIKKVISGGTNHSTVGSDCYTKFKEIRDNMQRIDTASNPFTEIKVMNYLIGELRKLMADEPRWASPHIVAGIAYVNLGNINAARDELKAAKERVPPGYEFAEDYVPHIQHLEDVITQYEAGHP